MRRRLGRSVAIVLGTCLAASAMAAQPTAAADAETEPEQTSAWQQLWHPAFRPSLGNGVELQRAHWLGDRFAITGTDERGAVVWWSDDGLEWARSPQSADTDHGMPAAIAAGPRGYVMVGEQWAPKPRGRIWHSADGLVWQRSASKLPRGSEVWAVASLEDGTFVAYGARGRGGGCWMGTSSDGGATWDFRWKGDWEPGGKRGCLTAVAREGAGLTGRIDGDISASTDGIAWRRLIPSGQVDKAFEQAKGIPDWVGLEPLGEGRFMLGRRGPSTIVWSREGGLELDDEVIDWGGMWRMDVAVGPERTVAVRGPAPRLSPPVDAYADPWERRETVCKPNQPTINHIAAMRPGERLACYGDRDLAFEAWIPFSEYGGICEFGDPHRWMICENYWLATGPGWSPGYLNFGWAPGARNTRGVNEGSAGAHVRVTGHFDDSAARQCPEPGWDGPPPEGWDSQTRADFVDDCRKQFIVTEMRRVRD